MEGMSEMPQFSKVWSIPVSLKGKSVTVVVRFQWMGRGR